MPGRFTNTVSILGASPNRRMGYGAQSVLVMPSGPKVTGSFWRPAGGLGDLALELIAQTVRVDDLTRIIGDDCSLQGDAPVDRSTARSTATAT